MEKLFAYMARYGGTIELMDSLSEPEIEQAGAGDRLYIDENCVGFVWMPDRKPPATPEEAELYKRWFPLK